MFERMMDEKKEPSKEEIIEWIGENAKQDLDDILFVLEQHKSVSIALVYPFGKQYGWGYRIGFGKEMLCHLFFEKGAITAMLSITSKKVNAMELLYPQLSNKTQTLWDHRYPCGKGGWIHVRIETPEDKQDVITLLFLKMGKKGEIK